MSHTISSYPRRSVRPDAQTLVSSVDGDHRPRSRDNEGDQRGAQRGLQLRLHRTPLPHAFTGAPMSVTDDHAHPHRVRTPSTRCGARSRSACSSKRGSRSCSTRTRAARPRARPSSCLLHQARVPARRRRLRMRMRRQTWRWGSMASRPAHPRRVRPKARHEEAALEGGRSVR